MANKYANLIGTNLIKDEYTKINTGFDGVETDIANHETAADPHDQYALDTDLATLQTEVTSHKAESASKHITESGSNDNGSYIKFDDGTMICSSSYNLISEIYAAGDHTYRWTFPAIFLGRAYVSNIMLSPVMQRGEEDMVKLNYFNARQSTDTELDGSSVLLYFGFSQGLTSAFRPKMTAIGRWK